MRQNYSKKRRNTWRAIARRMKIADLRGVDYKDQPHRLSKQKVHETKDEKTFSLRDLRQLLAESDSYDEQSLKKENAFNKHS